MAKVKRFNNGPSLCAFIAKGAADADAVLAQITINNRVFLQNAVRYAERKLDVEALPVLREALQKLGGSVKATHVYAAAKDYRAHVTIKFSKDVIPDIRAVALGFANKNGGLLSSNTADDSFVYGFSPELAKCIVQRLNGVKGVTIGLVK